MKYPTISDYIESLSCAIDNFATLSPLDLILDTQGRPVFTREKHSVIFKMKDVNSNIEYDVKCFTDEQENRKTLYEQIANDQDVWFPKGVAFYDKEIFVDTENSDDKEFPVVITPHRNTTNIIPFLSTNRDNHVLLSKLTYSFSLLFSWVYEKGYTWYEVNFDSLSVDDNGHVFVSNTDEILETSNKSNDTGHLSAALIHLSLKAISKDENLFDANNVRPQILFDVDKRDDLPSNEIIGKLLRTGDSEILSIIGAIFVHLGKGDYCGIQSSVFKVNLPSMSDEDDLMTLAKSGDVRKQVELAKQCWEKEMYEESFKWYEQAASQDNVDGLYGLGLCYREGLGTEKDLAKSFRCFLKASESGLLEAQFALAEAYYFGWGIDMDPTKAMNLYYKAALKGHAESEFMVGHHYMINIGEIGSSLSITNKKDTAKAFEWFMKSAIQGYHPAQRRIGAFYETGTDPCVRNISKAMEWYQKAAAQGNDKAMFAIGRLFANGLDEKNPDNKKAFEYYLQAAEKGLRDAQYRVGIALLFGKGIDKDKKAAMQWINKSANQGYMVAKRLLSVIEKKDENRSETEITGLDLATADMDDYGVLYSHDGKKLLKYGIEEVDESLRFSHISEFDEELEFGCIKKQSLNHYEVKKGTEIICEDAFSECESLEHISLPSTLYVIGESAFFGCKNLSGVTSYSALKRIGDRAFMDCHNLKSIDSLDGVESIGEGAFSGCYSLYNLVIPSALQKITGSTLRGVKSILSKSENFFVDDNCLLSADRKTLIYFLQNEIETYEIPYGVENIGSSAFEGSGVNYLLIPQTVKIIGNSAFAGCSIKEMCLPDSITKIGQAAFCGCQNLTRIHLPNRLSSIDIQTFDSCRRLTNIHLPSSIKEINHWAFARTGLSSFCFPINVEKIGWGLFAGTQIKIINSESESIIVRDRAIYSNRGKTLSQYYGNEKKFVIPEGVEEISKLSFTSYIKEIIFPKSIKKLCDMIWYDGTIPEKIYVHKEFKKIILEYLPEYYYSHVFVIEDDCN